MRKLAALLVILGAVLVVGCGDKKGETPGYSKADFAKTPPPSGYLGSVPKGPGVTPPAGGAGK